MSRDSMNSDSSVEGDVKVTFHSQVWKTKGSDDYAVPDSDREPVSFYVPRSDAVNDDGEVFPNNSYESDDLATHQNAPDWIKNWIGTNPFYIEIED